MKTFKKKVKKSNLYSEYVKLLNGILQLSYRESEVFSLLLRLNNEMSELVSQTGNIMSTDIRTIIMKETGITKTNLMKYLYVFRDKLILIPNGEGKWFINETFVPKFEGDVSKVLFILETNEQ